MGKKWELKEQILKESETEKELKEYLLKMNMFMGEDVANSLLSYSDDIVESLNMYTNKFASKKSREIAFILLRGAILSSNNNNYYIQVIKNKLSFGEFQDMLDLININNGFRKCLTRNLINEAKYTDRELYEKLENKEHVLEDLDNLRFYEQIKNEKEKEARLVRKSK